MQHKSDLFGFGSKKIENQKNRQQQQQQQQVVIRCVKNESQKDGFEGQKSWKNQSQRRNQTRTFCFTNRISSKATVKYEK